MRKRLFLLASVGIVPLALACALAFFKIAQAEQQKDDEAARGLVAGIATAVEVELGGSMAVLQALSTSTLLDEGRLADYGRLTERVLATRPEWLRINVFTPDGDMVATAGRPGARAMSGLVERESFSEMIATQQPRWGYVAKGPSGGLAVPLRVPVVRDGRLRYVLTAVVRAGSLAEMLQRHALPEGAHAVVLDGRQRVVASSAPSFAAPGEPLPAAAPPLRRTYRAALPSGWAVLAVHDAPASWTARHVGLVPYAAGLSLSLLLAFGLAGLVAVRISRPIGQLRAAAQALGRGEPPPPSDTSINELREVADALLTSSQQLHAARAEAERASRSKDHFIAMLGHELRNPLAAIGSTLALMAQREPQASVRERAILERQAGQLARLVDDLLDVSRLMRGKLELRRTPVLLNQLVHEACEGAAAQHGAERIALTLPAQPLWVLGDAARLAQVLGNLLSNALKFSPPEGRVAVTLHAQAQACIEVSDHGEGIDAALLPFIFEAFVQGEQSLQRARGGLGLGLAIVKELVERHGGSVQARSAGPGAGATFEVRLPLTAAPPPAAAPVTPPAPPATLPRRVLLVDDEPDILESLSLLLALEGLEVRTAGSAAQAQAVLAVWQPDAVVLDIGLPDEDGYALARRLRAAQPSAQHAPFALIAMTGYGQQADRDSAAAAGFDVHLTKPVQAETLLDTLARCHHRAAPRDA